MILNTHPNNKYKTFDLTEEELVKFYKGCGNAELLVDKDNNIVTVSYDDRAEDTYLGSELQIEGRKIISGIFSCTQFCEI